jgi:hypothetical protein
MITTIIAITPLIALATIRTLIWHHGRTCRPTTIGTLLATRITTHCSTRRTTDSASNNSTLLTTPAVSDRRTSTATYRAADGTTHLRVIHACAQQKYCQQTDFIHYLHSCVVI